MSFPTGDFRSGTLRAVVVDRDESGQIAATVRDLPHPPLAAGEVRIQVAYSSLNFKDALVATGHPALATKLPLTPGIDAAGVVVESQSPQFVPGQEVIATSYDLGVGRGGGWSPFLTAPAEWLVPLPAGLSLREAMILGTAGLTVGMCLEVFQRHPLAPDAGEVLVTGASGGVGSLAVRILAHAGYRVVAVTGKQDHHAQLRAWGAAEVLPRGALADDSTRPLLKGRWAGVIDVVGGSTLVAAIRQTLPHGCVCACGLTGGTELPLTIYPFIVRGVTLAGIDSPYCPQPRRTYVWHKLAGAWKPPQLEDGVKEVNLDEVRDEVPRILRGDIAGRILVRP